MCEYFRTHPLTPLSGSLFMETFKAVIHKLPDLYRGLSQSDIVFHQLPFNLFLIPSGNGTSKPSSNR